MSRKRTRRHSLARPVASAPVAVPETPPGLHALCAAMLFSGNGLLACDHCFALVFRLASPPSG